MLSRRLGAALAALAAVAAFPAVAGAARVVVLGPHGRAAAHDDPFVHGPAVTPPPASTTTVRTRRAARHATGHKPKRHKRKRHKRKVTVGRTLAGIYRHHHIDATHYHGYLSSYNSALAAERRLHGTRRSELAAVTATVHDMAARHQLNASRLPAVFATVDANRRWWTTGPLLSAYQRVEFSGSQLVWEHYPGQGIQLQVLGSFGKADGLYTAGPSEYPAMEQLLSEIIPLAARRGGGLTWEYYFPFDGGSPPWTSAMSQATGLEALSRADAATGDGRYLQVARRALPIFSVAPPKGVAARTRRGLRFIQYTFKPRASIINADLQTLIGLYSYAQASGDPTAAQLFSEGNAEALAEVPHFDTGAWSLYRPGVEDDLGYHELVTGFLQQLCTWTGAPTYCTTAQHFTDYLTTPPTITQLTRRAVVKKPIRLRFRLSKSSHVGVVITRGAKTVLATSAGFPYGVHHFTVPAQKRRGTYGIVLTATGPAGNFTRITGSLRLRRGAARSGT